MNALLKELYSRLGSYRDAGANVYFNCPFCDDSRRRMGVSLTKGVYGCFNCDARGGLPYLLRHLRIEASLPRPSHEREKPVLESSVTWPEDSVALSLFRKGYLSTRANKYLKTRKLKLTWCIQNAVRYTTKGRLADRVIFPSIRGGKLEYWVARAISNDMKPKTMHPAGISRPIWTYSSWSPGPQVVITEGVFDAIVAEGCATLGCGVSRQQVQELAALGAEEYVIAFDGDRDGRIGSHKLADTLSRETSAKISIVQLPEDKDPADLGTEAMKELIEQRKEYSLADYVSALM
jgi:hypothetical protein